ncbi:ATP-binding cassette domain-containing protein [Pseudarthrobacter sulfonivorans]|uniref:ABC transporter ATP-binding protein n=1 Tax=Pseudarthrobacter sulfonivorans TaxID=121292 RepID=UPI0028587B66|nr:ATP-binding cassette domain-containing protein [Pseudarthrobacter sulfonivorans]MDR6417135.1 energy-coupling factor transport system ATP-binding protein [Pseudarthrobacter sulfonivorans]
MRGTLTPALAARIGHFTYPGDAAPALGGINLSLAPGTLTAVLGGSGSGKSTLGRLLAGWLRPGSGGSLEGFLDLAGERLEFRGTSEDPQIDPAAWCRQVGFVPQDAAAALSTVRATVAEELAFGLENRGAGRPEMHEAVRRVASLTGLDSLLDRDPARISGGELRRLAIGCAIITGPAVLVLDEPFASLDTDGAAALTALVRSLVAGGTAVVVLSQAVDALLSGADRWILLNDGAPVVEGTPAQLATSPELAAAGVIGTGTKGDHSPPQRPARAHPADAGSGPAGVPALELRDVSFAYDRPRARRRFRRVSTGAVRPAVLDGVCLSVHPGEIVAVIGPNGAGKTTLLRHLNGLLRPLAGSVRINGQDIAGLLPGTVAADVSLLFQDPRDQLFERTAEREVGFGLAGGPAAAASVRRALSAVGLAEAAGKHPAELPASLQRLLALATVLARQPSVMALDEPTVALDRHGLARLDTAVRHAAAEGAAVVLVTHDLDYARSTAHRIVRLDAGRLQGV